MMKNRKNRQTVMFSAVVAAIVFGSAARSAAQDRDVFFDVDAAGVSKSISTWGLDTAWLDEVHVRRGVVYMGQPQVDVIRFSFTGDTPVSGTTLTGSGLTEFNQRMSIVNTWTNAQTKLYLNNDTESYDSSYIAGDGYINASAWAQLINATKVQCANAGRTVVTVAAFNEPDATFYSNPQNNITRFGDACAALRNNHTANFNGVRLMGGNTLDAVFAATWYNPLNASGYLEEGNTHQLGGSFDNYAAFYQSVKANGDVATNDELHNVMEAMVGAEYGMEAGIWWDSAEYARGQFVKASDGVRLGYAEHRPNWTAASVYRAPGAVGKVQAFIGESERQALPTTYRFVSKDRPVYFDGYGPQRTYSVTTTGGPGYATAAHRNAEKLVNITWGEDVQPAINGRYMLVARNSGKVMEVAGGSTTNSANIRQNNYGNGNTYQQWDVVPMTPAAGYGDYTYFSITNANSGKVADVANNNLDAGGNVQQYDNYNSWNQQWILEYADDGYFYIRSRWSGLYLEVANASTANNANIQQNSLSAGTKTHQQWRLVPEGSAVEVSPPAAPTNLVATANDVSVALSWTASGATDLDGYNIYRATSPSGPFEMIARGVTATSYTDASANQSVAYDYKVKAVDKSLNRSGYSNQVSATPVGSDALVAHLSFENSPNDDTVNANDGKVSGSATYGTGADGSQALVLNGSTYVDLPAEVVNHDNLTVAAWVYWSGGSDWQRIFDFGNGTAENLFLTPKAAGAGLRFEMTNGTNTFQLNAPVLASGQWVHVAVTLGATARLYVNGTSVAESGALTLRPSDINPVLNMLGKSQWPDPLFAGKLDDFRIYNYALSPQAVFSLASDGDPLLTGTSIGTTGSWGGDSATTRDAALDGNLETYFDAAEASGAWVGLDLGSPYVITQLKYAPRPGFAFRMVGGVFEASNSATFSSGVVTLHPIASTPVEGAYTTVSVSNPTAYRYVRYVGPANGYCNVAEIVFQGVAATTAPAAPTGLVATAGNGQVGLSWSASSGATSYNVKRSTTSGTGYSTIASVTSGTGYFDNAVNNGTTYYYVVAAVNAGGEGANSTQAGATPVAPPAVPGGLLVAVVSGTGIDLSWNTSAGATSYNVKRSETTGGPYSTIATGLAGTSHNDSGLTPGTTYFYVVSAVNASGESADSAEDGGTTWTLEEEWRFAHFGTTENTGDAAGEADPDEDGANNTLERAFGGDPNVAEFNLMPAVDDSVPMLAIVYRKSLSAPDLKLTVLENTDLSSPWIPATGGSEVLSDNGSVQEIRFTRPAGGAGKLFLRVEVATP